jgi:hypothetical protein
MGWFQDLTDPNHMTLSYLDATASAVPEPITALELAIGLALLARRRRS